jgi:hypothetical protein
MAIYSITEIMSQEHTSLQFILNKVNMLKELNAVLQQVLEPNLARQCQIANINNDTLVIVSKNAAIATTLRFKVPDLLPQFQQHPVLKNIQHISCKVAS